MDLGATRTRAMSDRSVGTASDPRHFRRFASATDRVGPRRPVTLTFPAARAIRPGPAARILRRTRDLATSPVPVFHARPRAIRLFLSDRGSGVDHRIPAKFEPVRFRNLIDRFSSMSYWLTTTLRLLYVPEASIYARESSRTFARSVSKSRYVKEIGKLVDIHELREDC